MKTIDFRIREGKHRSRPFVIKFFRGYGVYRFKVRFTEEMWHAKNEIPHPGVNKLFGYSLPFHGEKTLGKIPFIKNWVNSWLVGWRPGAFGKFVLFKYMDIKGVETRTPITTVDFKEYEIELGIFKYTKWICVNNVEVAREAFKSPGWGFFLKPYFGGQSVSLRDMIVRISSTFKPVMVLLLVAMLSCKPICRDVVVDYYDKDTVLKNHYEVNLCGVDLEYLEGTPQDYFLYQVKPDTLYRSWRYK